jgi:hypothetical protein
VWHCLFGRDSTDFERQLLVAEGSIALVDEEAAAA